MRIAQCFFQVSPPQPLLACQPACRPVPAHCLMCRQVSFSRFFTACASISVSPGVNASISASVLASASTSACAPPPPLPTDYSSISGTVSASVSTRACALPSVSPSVTQQVIECVRIAQCVARCHRLHLC